MRNLVEIIAILMILLGAMSARAERWVVVPDQAEVVFISKAPLETFKGRTRDVKGWVDWNPEDLSVPLDGEIIVDLASLDTGKDKRNRHMRENHLETDRYPEAKLHSFVVVTRSSDSLPVSSEVDIRLRGKFDLHGVTRPLECIVVLTRNDEGAVTVTTTFPVLLSDHDIERPKFLIMKLADEQKVEVKLELQPGDSQ